MSSTNQSPEFITAQKKYLASQTDEARLLALEEMLKFMPKHKAGEALRANLRQRYKKLKEKLETRKKQKKSGKQGIKKSELQAVLVGLTQSGKSSLLSILTNAKPLISSHEFTTKECLPGILEYYGARIQLIDMPAINSEYSDLSLVNTADTLLIVIDNPKQLAEIFPLIEKAFGEKLIILNKIDLLTEEDERRLSSQLQSKKLNFVLFSCKTLENLEELKEKIWLSFHKIRIYTKEPGKPLDNEPVILNPGSTIKELAEKIFHKSIKIKEIKVTGPSSKFPNQKIGLEHVLKDKDIVEFRTE